MVPTCVTKLRGPISLSIRFQTGEESSRVKIVLQLTARVCPHALTHARLHAARAPQAKGHPRPPRGDTRGGGKLYTRPSLPPHYRHLPTPWPRPLVTSTCLPLHLSPSPMQASSLQTMLLLHHLPDAIPNQEIEITPRRYPCTHPASPTLPMKLQSLSHLSSPREPLELTTGPVSLICLSLLLAAIAPFQTSTLR